jgi:hypothetical protein
MVSPIYDLNPSIDITQVGFPSGASNSTLDSGAVNGMEAEHILVDPVMEPKVAPKNPPPDWSA